ncbi:hypothetical protein AVEN_58467-1 [Araneus ventricosus]|uniref:Uncharacterized protein n=1 Tax=Araneus ventricosus TaxID=182803 RepID=A0A4Y2PP71_ARAVE|nr:hypothetical protein AVEN_160193-1 [Araneus ventricosus]GBN52037.1 hypothetical protein AVEN_58467-1 [Araneus ventricosus]
MGSNLNFLLGQTLANRTFRRNPFHRNQLPQKRTNETQPNHGKEPTKHNQTTEKNQRNTAKPRKRTNETQPNHGKGTNPSRTIIHHLSVAMEEMDGSASG